MKSYFDIDKEIENIIGRKVSYQDGKSKIIYTINKITSSVARDYEATKWYHIHVNECNDIISVSKKNLEKFLQDEAIEYPCLKLLPEPQLFGEYAYKWEQRWWEIYKNLILDGEEEEVAATKADNAIKLALQHSNGIF